MGMLHIYYGDGKGKTTAALGMALRAAGSGIKVQIVQFLKGSFSSELESLKYVPDISVARCDRDYGFTFTMSDDDKREITSCHDRMFSNAIESVSEIKYNLIVFDELSDAYNYKLINTEMVDNYIKNIPEKAELVITGRNPCELFLKRAGYISEIKNIRHPYTEHGIAARRGIEY